MIGPLTIAQSIICALTAPGFYPTAGDRTHAMRQGGPDAPIKAGAKDWQIRQVSTSSRGGLDFVGWNGCNGESIHWGFTCLGAIGRFCFAGATWEPGSRAEFNRMVKRDKDLRRASSVANKIAAILNSPD